MKVKIDRDEQYEDTIGVYLNNGEEIGRYCIVDDAEKERELLESMLKRCCDEATRHLEKELSTIREFVKSLKGFVRDYKKIWGVT